MKHVLQLSHVERTPNVLEYKASENGRSILHPERFASYEPPLYINSGNVPIISTKQESLQEAIKDAVSPHIGITVQAPNTRVPSIIPHTDQQCIKALPRCKRSHLLIDVADLGTAERGKVEQGRDRKLSIGKFVLLYAVLVLALHGYDLRSDTSVLDTIQN